ncbi:uncharacterized protein LOC123885031 [Trifolium pratense]|uniref:Uncharacterized protein n=2 Tax=Trifolium pratense TaxID=57577 RepID=A0ACB0L3U0_TRIPR|nr:uncharacterized protein LOC123885031 [Trifolium pratense]XP_045790210.1 uncharacterized protein LOC123885031 [Trifolium pratense]XP_045790211.1 uncharacterized protein LOC123885031 [Trifolium pratense]CAJ2663252.1 unnamed protein product [Trifolium pratense]
MNKSSAQPSHFDDYGFDLHQDFSMFLEEAKEHGHESKLKSSSVYPEEGSKKPGSEKETKRKKSWKSLLTSWLKFDKKNKVQETSKSNNNPKSKVSEKKHGHVSGPVHNSYKGYDHGKQQKRPFSGPLMTSLFKPTKIEENEIPYMTLDEQNSSHPVRNYGPLYLVS